MSGGLSEQAMGVVCVGCEYGHGAEQRPGGVPTDSAGRQFVYLAGEWRCPDCVQRAWDLATAEADAAEERADRAERALADCKATLERIGRCRVRYGGRPPGFTCLDQQRDAQDPASRYVEEFRQSILKGERLCDGCRASACLARLGSEAGE